LLRLPDDRIALFYLQKNSLTDCRPVVRFSTDEAETWSEPSTIIPDDDVGYFILNNDRVVQLGDGRLVVPVAVHHRPDWSAPQWQGKITCYLSDDAGQTWHRSETMKTAENPAGTRIYAQEPGVVQLDDGRLLMWIRTNAGEQYQAFSSDRGETWTAFEPMGVASPMSPASIERIPTTGDLLMAWNNHDHLPVAQRRARTPFTVAVSSDSGQTWQHIKNLADDPRGWYCYTAIEFVGDHVLLGHVAGQQEKGKRLATSRITRVPIRWLYESAE